MNFPNILGVAASLAMLGFGHIEMGTITPNTHAGNFKPRIFRLTQDEALINGALLIIGIGGIKSAADVQAKTDAGASLVQLYTGLVYQGPGVAGHILRGLAKSANVANLQS